MKAFRKILLLPAVFAPSPLFACAACYGRSDAPMAVGMNWGIFTLLAVVGAVLAGFLTFLIYAIRRSEAQEAAREKRLKPDFEFQAAAGPAAQPN
jgi:hypothetical protein